MGGGGLTEAQRAYATRLRAIYHQWVWLPIREFARREDVPHEYSSVSRFLSGDRLAPRSFIDCLVQFGTAAGGADPEEAREQLLRLRLRTQVGRLRHDLDQEQSQRGVIEGERAVLREETRRQRRQLRAASDYLRRSASDHAAELCQARIEFIALEAEVDQLRQELDRLTTRVLRARAEGDQRDARLAELEAAAEGKTRARRSQARRLYYQEASSWRLQHAGAAAVVLSIGLGYLLIHFSMQDFRSTDVAMGILLLAFFMAGVTTVAYGTAGANVLRVTDEGLALPDQPLHPWAEIGKVTRIQLGRDLGAQLPQPCRHGVDAPEHHQELAARSEHQASAGQFVRSGWT